MFETIIEPRFSETDILGHINNTAFPVWFETARQDIFKLVHPNLSSHDWPMIIAHIDVDFILQTEYGNSVTIKSSISNIGNKSFSITHEAYQNRSLVAKGNAVLVWYNYTQQSSSPIPHEIRELLKQYQL
jgi:acyl-CoA thioester hydrolase